MKWVGCVPSCSSKEPGSRPVGQWSVNVLLDRRGAFLKVAKKQAWSLLHQQNSKWQQQPSVI